MASKRRSVLITGCSPGGIGYALAKEFSSRGFQVFATGRTVTKIASLQDFGIECVSLVVDDPTSVAECHEEVRRLLAGRGLDFVINNAGKTVNRPAVETDLAEAKDIFASNVLGVIDIIQTFLPELLAAKGTIVNMGSVAGHLPLPFNAVYCASKAALYAYSESLRVELAPLGVKVTYIQTGNVKTNILRGRTHLDEHSLWAAISEVFDKRQEIAATTGDEPEVFAKSLASKLLSGYKNVRWVGESAFVVRMLIALEHWLPFQLWPFMFSQAYKMEKIKARQDV